ncbi:rhomboid family protein [Peribacillus deserti]|uniref:Rhomboid family intramembrane serine protease n=1 Tax=Peribacillus deserti TaxID=673318 RepID=A0A2N5M4A5_9BACI|nr:rhomboid family intramembrane serine protease [Peribacillus deserti]PLT29194.1 rhomboid family intramembrane serine protease [Peribacillus deserti]
MGNLEQYLFWSTARHLIEQEQMSLIYMDTNQQEVWLRDYRKGSPYQVVKLAQSALTWSNVLKRDIDQTSVFGENNRGVLRVKELSIFTIYFTPDLPVDEYDHLINTPANFKKTYVHTFILDTGSLRVKLPLLESALGLQIPLRTDFGSVDEGEIQYLKQAVMQSAGMEIKKEQKLLESGRPFFTYVFLFLQIAAFLLLELNGGSQNTQTLIKYGAKYNPLILEGEWWRFFVPIFLHIGLLHLLTNSLSLYYIGSTAERIYGSTRFLFIYLFAGFAGSLASFLFNTSVSAGASGAIFGCFGALLYFGLLHPKTFFRTMGTNIILLVVINLGIGFTVPVVDNAGHIGGLIGGFLASAIVSIPGKVKLIKQGAALAAAILLVTLLLQYGYGEASESADEEVTVSLAQEHLKKEEYDQAYQILKEYTDDHSAAPKSYYLMAFVELKRNQTELAEEHLKIAVEQDQDFHEAHINLAVVYLNQQRLDDAERMAEKAVSLQPDQKEYRKILKEIKNYNSQTGEGV